MGLRYRKSINILPGVKMNIGKTSSSFTIGKRGSSINIGGRGVTGNFGIPGTGISYRGRISKNTTRRSKSSNNASHNVVGYEDSRYSGRTYKEYNPWTDKRQWGCACIILVPFLFAGFLIVDNVDYAFGSLLLPLFIYLILHLIERIKSGKHKRNNDRIKEESTIDSGKVEEEKHFILIPDSLKKHKLDPLFAESVALCVSNDNISMSLIQRKFSIGINRASLLLDQLEKCAIIERTDNGIKSLCNSLECAQCIINGIHSNHLSLEDSQYVIDEKDDKRLLVEDAKKMMGYLSESLMNKVWDAEEKGELYIEITESQFNEINDKYHKYNVLLPKCADLNNKGIEFEKNGDIQSAIDVYEENIKDGTYPANHAYDRLLVIYRKRKDYANEKRVCSLAIRIFKDEKYKSRLEKIKLLIQKK